MSVWSASSLMPGYSKALVGFDFRLPTMPALQPLNILNPSELERTRKAATLDPELWRTSEATAYDGERNGVNLIGQSADALYDGIAPPAVALVAFDVPQTLFTELAGTFGFRELESSRIFQNARWRLLGFDIADIRTQSSGLYSFDLTEPEQDKLRKAIPFPLNAWGLLNQDSDAIAICAEFDVVIPGHAPFAPCGVWSTHLA